MNPLRKIRMFTPGPTPLLPQAVVEPLLSPLNHRKEDFKVLFRDVQKMLQQVYKTQNEMLILACSGTGAMEAAMINLLAPGEKAVIASVGKFGERWVELARQFGIEAVILEAPYGESVAPERFEQALRKNPEAGAVFIQATETSTGALMDVEQIASLVRKRESTVLVVDAITGLGTQPLETDAWGLDIVIGGSQKAFMLPPGLAMLSVSPRAWERIECCNRSRYYFDLLRERKAHKEGQSAYTPAIGLVQGLKAALSLILQDGIDGFVASAALQAGSTRAAISRWGMTLFSKMPGNAVTAFVPPSEVDPSRVQKIMRDRFGALITGGQGSMKGKILRVGHVGYFDFLETLGMIGCLELSLLEAGASLELGSGTQAALEFYRKMRSTV